MSFSLSLPSLQNAPSASYTPPTLPTVASAETQAKSAASGLLAGGGATSTTAAGPTATQTPPANSFHQLLQQALSKTAQSMARNTASSAGIHPDQSRSPTNAQAATGHAISVIA